MVERFTYKNFCTSDVSAHDRLMRQAFGTTPERNAELRKQTQPENIRVLRHQSEVIAALSHVVCGQYLGGKVVPVTFVAGVAVSTHWRGKKVGTALFHHLFQECKDLNLGYVLLGGAILGFYRKLSFEFACTRTTYQAPLAKLYRSAHTSLLDIQPVEETASYPFQDQSRLKQIEDIYLKTAEQNDGLIARESFFWRERLEPIGQQIDKFLILNSKGKAEGYMAISHSRDGIIKLRDWGATSQAAAQTILYHLSNYQSNWLDVQWFGSPTDMLTLNMPDWGWKILKQEDLLIRIIDVERVLTSRGYNPCLDIQLGLKITDSYFHNNQGDYILTLKEGQGYIENTSSQHVPTIECDIATLSGIVTGHLPINYLVSHQRIKGTKEGLALLSLVFYGSKAWLQDIF